jgi:hypothetical protein
MKTIDELIELLEEARDEVGGDAEVRLAFQPSWPLAFKVDGVALQAEINDYEREEYDDEEEDGDGQSENVVWIVEGGHPSEPSSPYAPRGAWECVR